MSDTSRTGESADTDRSGKISIEPKKAAETDIANLTINANQAQWDKFHRLKEQYGFGTNASAARYFLNLGMLSIVDNDPRKENSESTEVQTGSAQTIREYVPEGRENAVDLKDELPEIIRDNMLDIVESDPEIERNGFEVWR